MRGSDHTPATLGRNLSHSFTEETLEIFTSECVTVAISMAVRSDPLQVMVVDDSDEFRDAFCALLVLEGYHPIACRNGEAAWTQLCAGVRPAAVVVDLALPKMSGREFLRLLRSTAWGMAIPVLLLSAWQRLETFAAEAERVLGKGTEPISIVRTIDRLTVGSA